MIDEQWKAYNADGARILKNWRVAAQDGRTLAVLMNIDDSDRKRAQLMAAAPELLAALQDILTHYNQAFSPNDWTRAADRAIAKAEA